MSLDILSVLGKFKFRQTGGGESGSTIGKHIIDKILLDGLGNGVWKKGQQILLLNSIEASAFIISARPFFTVAKRAVFYHLDICIKKYFPSLNPFLAFC